jgi:hypothetical protein
LRERTVRNIEAGVVLAGSLAAYAMVPEEVLLPIAWTVLPISVAGVFAIRACMDRSNKALASDPDADAIAIRERQALLGELGVLLALLGLSAFIVLLIEHTD